MDGSAIQSGSFHPFADLVLEQELGRHPCDLGVGPSDGATGLQELGPGDTGVRRVEDPGDVALAEVDDPLAKVTDVDELCLLFVRSRG